jgi:hypothetical protein
VSHRPERAEKICLNCNTEVYGRYCHACGQENIEPKETFWHLVTHFVNDVTHFDGKFFRTVKLLLTKPGFLSVEHIKGRRNSYLNPIRMYVFISAFFFLFFFSFAINETILKVDGTKRKFTYSQAVNDINTQKQKVSNALQDSNFSPVARKAFLSKLEFLNQDEERLKRDTTRLDELNVYSGINVGDTYNSVEAYDSLQQKLPPAKRDGWISKQWKHKKIQMIEKYGPNVRVIISAIVNKFSHYFPQVLFVSLPIFALLLKLFYNRRKEFYYGDHAIFSIHLYCAMFILIFFEILFSRIEDYSYFKWVSYVALLFLFFILWFIYKSLRNFYRQSRGKTILKYILLMFTSFFVMSMLFGIFLIFSVFTI